MSETIRLEGRQILVVEDETLIALLIEEMLGDLGCGVVGPAHALPEALALAAGAEVIDAALLDVNVGGRPVFEVVDVLRARGVPLVFSTGYGDDGLRDSDRGAPVLQKPFRLAEVETALRTALGG